MDTNTRVLDQPDRPVRRRRTARGRGRDRPQDHRRYLRRRSAARRRSVLGQGPHEGGPFGVLHGPLRRQERRGSRPRGQVPGAARVRHRRRRARVGSDRHLRHRHDRRRDAERDRARALQAHAQGHHRDPQPAPADLQKDGGLRPLRPDRAGVHLGTHRQGRRAAQGCGRVKRLPGV